MEEIPKLPNESILDILQPTIEIFKPLLDQRKTLVTNIPKKTYKYGPNERHQLDIYYPPASSPQAPILFYVYGGGFSTGARNSTEYVYSSLGAYFARKGFITVIADYRLVPEAQYPDQVGDVRDAAAWVLSNSAELVSSTTPNPDTNSLFLLGHSAGATHVATLFYHPSILPLNSDLRTRVKGIVLMAGVYDMIIPLKDMCVAYYGSESIAREQSPSALLDRMSAESVTAMPKHLLVEGQYEPKRQLEMGKNFEQLLEKKRLPFKKIIAHGHNHISVSAALSSGVGEEWAAGTAEWMHRIVSDVQPVNT